jgi:uncharacterized membrane protein
MMERAPRWAAPVTFPLALAGLALSTYLTYVHYAEPRALSCPDTGVVNCTKVTTSPESMLFGFFPVALAGALFFLAVTALMLPVAWRSTSRLIAWAQLGGAIAGVGMVCYLVYVEAIQVKALCLYCTAVHVIMFALFVAVLAAWLFPSVEDADEQPSVRRRGRGAAARR